MTDPHNRIYTKITCKKTSTCYNNGYPTFDKILPVKEITCKKKKLRVIKLPVKKILRVITVL